jgi:hypothetical protein
LIQFSPRALDKFADQEGEELREVGRPLGVALCEVVANMHLGYSAGQAFNEPN